MGITDIKPSFQAYFPQFDREVVGGYKVIIISIFIVGILCRAQRWRVSDMIIILSAAHDDLRDFFAQEPSVMPSAVTVPIQGSIKGLGCGVLL